MCKKNNIIILLITWALSLGVAIGQGHDLKALENEFPMLVKRYGDHLENRTAHYIFAIDISSSMREYENVVRQSLSTFVKAVPDGDQITLIAMCDENNTNYVNSIKCITIDQSVRKEIINTITSQRFEFLRRGNPNDGSDGYSMTKKVLEAMNVVNSSDLTFIYLLTDFEYWTHKYKFDKTKEDWDELKVLLTDKHRGLMCKYGIELNYNKVSHPEAIFKPELDNIFSPLDYQQASSAVILSQWFDHIINDIRAHKINVMLNEDWKEYLGSCSVTLRRDGQQLKAKIEAPKCDLVSGAKIALIDGDGSRLIPTTDVELMMENGVDKDVDVGYYEMDKTWYPSYLTNESTTARLIVSFESSYAEEVNKLNGLCQKNIGVSNVVNFNQEYVETIPTTKVWNAVLPLWIYVLLIIFVFGIIVSIVYTSFIHPERRDTSVIVKCLGGTVSKQYSGNTLVLPITIGSGGDVNIPSANWTLKIMAKKYNPIITWCSIGSCITGYYAILENGDYADVVNDYTDETIGTISKSKAVFLFPYRKAPKSRIEIAEGTTKYIIEIL